MLNLKNDKYRKVRGGTSKIVRINCSGCNFGLMLYQKDGIGILKRIYFDRILNPSSWTIGDLKAPIDEIKNLTCPGCSKVIGTPYIYQKEGRPAFLLSPGTITKTVVKRY